MYRSCYCAFCKNERQVYSRRHIGWPEAVGSLFVGLTVSLGFWETLDPRGFVFSVLFLILAEVTIGLRWRLALVCPKCGFDALVYIKSPKRAAQLVLQKREDLKKDTLGIFKTQAHANLPRRQTRTETAKLLRPPPPTDSLQP